MIYFVKKLFYSIVIAGFMAAGVAGSAGAADDPANVVKYRVNLMKAQTGHLRAIASVVKGEVSYGAHVKAHADAIKALSEMAGEVFPKGSGVGESRAKPEIWQDWDKFLAVYGTYKAEAAKLAEVAGSGDLAAIGAQLGNLGKSCGGCHKPFRKEK
jgi:cytochrome c556